MNRFFAQLNDLFNIVKRICYFAYRNSYSYSYKIVIIKIKKLYLSIIKIFFDYLGEEREKKRKIRPFRPLFLFAQEASKGKSS
ncbi:hypothetical protein A946_00835 [Methylacidiphilum kamchatkense Kam1]|uniref:Uncharacterized protein n=1 Tax=Methylacidiphilum kamchatkense Kam1 TaxID=1202785 RepID=A0ABR4ZYH6_9BACT|nr:hypothetical protein A946_00835 [Methylacidiphilum kamchatkense Kam1]